MKYVLRKGEHWYESEKKKGTYYPSPSTITALYPKGKGFEFYLASTTAEEASTRLDEAGKRGTRVHNATEVLDKAWFNNDSSFELSQDGFSPDEWVCLCGYNNFLKKENPKYVMTEGRTVSDKLKLGGTIDRVVALEDGTYAIYDIKTSSIVRDYFWLQVAAYAKLYEDLYKCKISKTVILHLSSSKKNFYSLSVHDHDEVQKDWDLFCSLRKIFDSKVKEEKNVVVDLPDLLPSRL